jgi:1,4-alpha-glucan branching enzyme
MNKSSKKKKVFTLVAPDAESVLLAGDFTDWHQRPLALKKDKSGIWKRTVTLPPGFYQYRFIVDGEWRDDPECAARVPNPFGTQNMVCDVR